MINHKRWAIHYDEDRNYDPLTAQIILNYCSPSNNIKILDFGCGTGNYLKFFSKFNQFELFGIDPSEDMLEIARAKCNDINIQKGDHANIPFEDNTFDIVYMIDVIQHINNNHMLFSQIHKILKNNGILFVLTISHDQLNKRPWNKFFKEAFNVQCSRFPHINNLIQIAQSNKLYHENTIIIEEQRTEFIPRSFLNIAKNKEYSFFYLISEEDYRNGISLLQKAIEQKQTWEYIHGETMLIFKKAMT